MFNYGTVNSMCPVHFHIFSICHSAICPLFMLVVVINDNSNSIENTTAIQSISAVIRFHGKRRKLL